MAGALSTLGLGSQGVLTRDIIDQLRAADESSIVKPIERKIESSENKQTVLSEIKTLLTDLNKQTLALSEPSLYQSKNANLTGDSISVESTSTAKEQDFEINVTTLATRSIQESATGYAYDEALVGAQTLTINGKDIEIGVTDTLKTLVEKINEQTNGEVEASILNVGGSDPFKLILKSSDTGVDSKIVSSSTGGLSFSTIGSDPVDASFELDGVTITRSSNKIDDLIEGVTLNLQTEGKTSVKIEQNNDKLIEEMEKFATSYNELIDKLSEVTKYDSENKSAGVFQGTSEIRSITSSFNNIVGSTITSEGKTVADFGFEPQRGGKLNFDKDSIDEMLKADPLKVKDFLLGTDGENGFFNKIEQNIFDVSTSSSGAMKSLDGSIEERLKALASEQTKAQERLDDRYSIMTKRFASFDAVIGRLSNESSMLSSMIDAQYADK